jgi:hypothetical protein
MGQANREELAKIFQASWPFWLLLFAFLAGASWLIFRIRARFRGGEDPAEQGQQMLMQMGDLHREGGLSDEEYRSIKSRLKPTIEDSMRGSSPNAQQKTG